MTPTADDFAAELEREFGTRQLPLDAVCSRFLGCDTEHARKQAAKGKLDVPVYQAGSRKSPPLVRAEDLGKVLASRYLAAHQQWCAMQGGDGFD